MIRNSCLRAVVEIAKWFPVIFISAIVCWAYYAYVVELCIREIGSPAQKALYLIFFHVSFILFVWSYYQCIFTNGGEIPKKFYLSSHQVSELEQVQMSKNYEEVKKFLALYAQDLPVHNRGFNGDVRYCEKCFLIKPDRAHHCSVCERCILKMDHHCPWVNNCVCFNNYKFFVLFLGYAVVLCLYIALTDLPYFIGFWQDSLTGTGNRFHILFLFFVSAMFSISLVTLLSYHIYLTFRNRSTIEGYRSPVFVGGADKNGFSLGWKKNFEEVFGSKPLLWFVPVFTRIFRWPLMTKRRQKPFTLIGLLEKIAELEKTKSHLNRSPSFCGLLDARIVAAGPYLFEKGTLRHSLQLFYDKGDGSYYPVSSTRSTAYQPQTMPPGYGVDNYPNNHVTVDMQSNREVRSDVLIPAPPLSYSNGRGYTSPVRHVDDSTRDLLDSHRWPNSGAERSFASSQFPRDGSINQPRLVAVNEPFRM